MCNFTLINWQAGKLKIVFFGTPEFGAIVLEKLIEAGYKPILVVTAPDKPVGRKQIMTPPPVKLLAKKYKIPVLQTEKILDSKSYILNSKPDLIIVAAYGQIIPKEILDISKYGGLNVHPSLLPKYRGPSPIQAAILNGDEETGVTIILMDEKMDHGPILAQQEWEIRNPKSEIRNKFQIQNSKITYQELNRKLAGIGAKLLIETIPKWMAGKIKPKPQDETKASYTKILKKEDGKIDWTQSAEYIARQIRALNPWPGTFTKYEVRSMKSEEKKEKILKIYEAEVFPCNKKLKMGEVFLTENNGSTSSPQRKMAVKTGQDCLIIEKLQLEGKNKMTAKEFLNGYPEIVGSVLE